MRSGSRAGPVVSRVVSDIWVCLGLDILVPLMLGILLAPQALPKLLQGEGSAALGCIWMTQWPPTAFLPFSMQLSQPT